MAAAGLARDLPAAYRRAVEPLRARPEDHFTFGLWTVGNRGRDPFGHETRPAARSRSRPCTGSPSSARTASTSTTTTSIPPGLDAAEREAILKRFRTRARRRPGMRVPMATTNLFSHPVFKDGAFTANDPKVRRHALRKTLDAIDLGAELGAEVFVMWGGREGVECRRRQGRPHRARLLRRGGQRAAARTSSTAATTLEIALEPKPNEPRGDLLLPTVGHALAFIHELEYPEMVGLNPEFAHETMCGLSFHHAVAQALWADKLFHIDLNGQVPGKYDQDFRFGSEGVTRRVLPREAARGRRVGRHAPLRRARVPHRGRRRRVGVRPRLHAHVPDPARRRRSGSPTTPRSRRRSPRPGRRARPS